MKKLTFQFRSLNRVLHKYENNSTQQGLNALPSRTEARNGTTAIGYKGELNWAVKLTSMHTKFCLNCQARLALENVLLKKRSALVKLQIFLNSLSNSIPPPPPKKKTFEQRSVFLDFRLLDTS